MADAQPPTFRWTMLLRLVAIALVQVAIGRWLLASGVLKDHDVLGAKWFSPPHSSTVIVAALVADICVCGVILCVRSDNAILVAIASLGSLFGAFFAVCFGVDRFTLPIEFFGILLGGTVIGWLLGCLLATRFRINSSPLEKPKLQFTLREIFIAMLIAAIGAWLISQSF